MVGKSVCLWNCLRETRFFEKLTQIHTAGIVDKLLVDRILNFVWLPWLIFTKYFNQLTFLILRTRQILFPEVRFGLSEAPSFRRRLHRLSVELDPPTRAPASSTIKMVQLMETWVDTLILPVCTFQCVMNEVQVIIPYSPAHTPQKYLDRTISTIENQTISAEPLIITDEDQRGPAWARNQGLKKAQAKYLAFCDADDYWKESKLEKQIRKLNSEDTSLCITQTTNHDSRETNVSAFDSTTEFVNDVLYKRSQSFISSVLIDGSRVNIQFNEEISRREDHLFVLQAITHSGISFIPEELTIIHKHQSGLSESGINLQQRIQDEERFYNELKRLYPILENQQDDFWHLQYYRYGRKYYYQRDYKMSCVYLKKALKHKFNLKTLVALTLSRAALLIN